MTKEPELKPTREQVREHVVSVIAAFRQKSPNAVRDTDKLGEDLHFDDKRLPYLAMSLRAYIKHFNESKTLLVNEIDKPSTTVSDVIAIVLDRFGFK
jgi:hypothetical protein